MFQANVFQADKYQAKYCCEKSEEVHDVRIKNATRSHQLNVLRKMYPLMIHEIVLQDFLVILKRCFRIPKNT